MPGCINFFVWNILLKNMTWAFNFYYDRWNLKAEFVNIFYFRFELLLEDLFSYGLMLTILYNTFADSTVFMHVLWGRNIACVCDNFSYFLWIWYIPLKSFKVNYLNGIYFVILCYGFFWLYWLLFWFYCLIMVSGIFMCVFCSSCSVLIECQRIAGESHVLYYQKLSNWFSDIELLPARFSRCPKVIVLYFQSKWITQLICWTLLYRLMIIQKASKKAWCLTALCNINFQTLKIPR